MSPKHAARHRSTAGPTARTTGPRPVRWRPPWRRLSWRGRWPAVAALAALAILTAVLIVALTPGPKRAAATAPVGPLAPVAGIFGPQSVWRTAATGDTVAAGSAAMVARLAGQVRDHYDGIAAFNAYDYDPSFYTVAADQARVDVRFDNCQAKPAEPAGLLGDGGVFTAVPIPAGAVPADGTDSALSVYQPATDTLWDFWRATKSDSGWSACWGGRIEHVSGSPGWFPDGFGAAATGLAYEGGMVGVREARTGSIDHAIALAVPDPATTFVAPAQRGDGSATDPAALPEGSRLRLDPTLDVAALHLGPLATMIARAAQTYGFVVVDKSGAVSVLAESGKGEQAATGTNPWDALLGGTPAYQVLKGFPWSRLQVLAPPR